MENINKYFFRPEIGKQYFYIGQEDWGEGDEKYVDTKVEIVKEVISPDIKKFNELGIYVYKVRSTISGVEFETHNLSLLTTSEFVKVGIKQTHAIKL